MLLNLSHPKPTRPLTTRTSRKIHNLPILAFIVELSSLPTTTSAELHQSLSTILDKYAPLVTRTTDSSWYTSSLLKQKRILRTVEKHYLKHPYPTSLTSYNNLKNIHRKAITTAKATHITLKFHKLSNDSKSIHRLSAQLLCPSLKAPLPTTTAEQLSLLFDKVFNDNLSATLSALPTPTLCPTPIPFPSSLILSIHPHFIE